MKRDLYLLGLILLGASARVLPHPPNFTPTGALAFFGGNKISNRWLALFLPLAILFASDLVLGWHKTFVFVYGSFVLTAFLGMKFHCKTTRNQLWGLTLSSLIFFAVTNFGVWLTSGMYSKTLPGLFACYWAALPFLRNEVAGALIYGVAFFAVAHLAQKRKLVSVI